MPRAIPTSVSHLVLIVTAAHGGFIPRAQAIVRERGTPEQQAVCEKVWAGAFRSAEEMRHYYAVMGPMYARSYDAAAAEAGRARGIHSPDRTEPGVRAGRVPAAVRSAAGAGRITAPTLVMAGRHDWICPPEFSEEIARLIPGSDLRVFERSSHSIRGDEPEAMVDAILGFMVYRPGQGG